MKKDTGYTFSRRHVIKTGLAAGAAMMLPWRFLPARAFAASAFQGLSDPALQPKFVELAPNALHPSFKFSPNNVKKGKYQIIIDQGVQYTGLVDLSGTRLPTTVWGYGRNGRGVDWPGRTFEVPSGKPIEVMWQNKLVGGRGSRGYLPHLLPVDTNLHWAYSLHGYTQYTIENAGVPMIPHLHGGYTDFQFDGNPEFFFSPGWRVRGPQWRDKKFIYSNDQPAGNLWYHDHALGITRLNVYAGLAGFYFIRDQFDTGLVGNPLDLPAYPYELAYAIQDRMFTDTGALFYPAFPNEPYYNDFIDGEGALLPEDLFRNGGPSALAEFFGDHMVVNGKIWPKENVEPRNYRMRLLNGTDSRFLAIQFFEVPPDATDLSAAIGGPLEFNVVGSDQGLASAPTPVGKLLFEPGSRYDIIVDFSQVTFGNRVIMKNIGGDEPFGGNLVEDDGELQIFDCTDRIMAFDVILSLSSIPDVTPINKDLSAFGPIVPAAVDRYRQVALFEGKDEFGRLQPLLGTAEPATDYLGNPINWPDTSVYSSADLTGPMEGSMAWHSPTTENPKLGDTEEWWIWNATGDGHPVHLHLVHFEVIGRKKIKWDSNTNEEERVLASETVAAGDGTYLVPQTTVQHNSVAGNPSTYGRGFRIVNPTYEDFPEFPDDQDDAPPDAKDGYVENARKDMVTALPEQVTIIRAHFDKPGRYVWHCHILSHEDHEMMRVLHVDAGA